MNRIFVPSHLSGAFKNSKRVPSDKWKAGLKFERVTNAITQLAITISSAEVLVFFAFPSLNPYCNVDDSINKVLYNKCKFNSDRMKIS